MTRDRHVYPVTNMIHKLLALRDIIIYNDTTGVTRGRTTSCNVHHSLCETLNAGVSRVALSRDNTRKNKGSLGVA